MILSSSSHHASVHPTDLFNGASALLHFLPSGSNAGLQVMTHSQAVKCLCPCKDRVLMSISWKFCSRVRIALSQPSGRVLLPGSLCKKERGVRHQDKSRMGRALTSTEVRQCEVFLMHKFHQLFARAGAPDCDVSLLSCDDVVVVCVFLV